MSKYQLYNRPRLGPLLLAGGVGVGAAAGIGAISDATNPPPPVTYEADIVGGSTADDSLLGPVVRLSYRNDAGDEVQRCSGSVIAAAWVLTAAHCLHPTIEGDQTVRQVIGIGPVEFDVIDARVHPLYLPDFVPADAARPGAHYDVAVVRADRPLGVQDIDLARHEDEGRWAAGTQLTIAGHGADEEGGQVSVRLLTADTPRLAPSACTAWGEYVDSDLHLCTSSMTTATCNGDSGGPVLLPHGDDEWLQVGVMSYGDTECGSGVPDVHVRVDIVRSWIEDQVGYLSAPEMEMPDSDGYWLVTGAGEVVEFGDAAFHGDLSGLSSASIVDIAVSPSSDGYLLIDEAGGVHAFGRTWISSGLYPPPPGDQITAAALTPSGAGLWLFTQNGIVTAIGDAGHHGDLTGHALNGMVVDAVGSPSGNGYWLVGADGGVFTFGDARFLGSLGGVQLNQAVVSMAATPSGDGYWLVAADGGVFAFGSSPFRGSVPAVLTPGTSLNAPIRGVSAYGDGYVLFAADGGVFAFSDRPFRGSLGNGSSSSAIAGVGVMP